MPTSSSGADRPSEPIRVQHSGGNSFTTGFKLAAGAFLGLVVATIGVGAVVYFLAAGRVAVDKAVGEATAVRPLDPAGPAKVCPHTEPQRFGDLVVGVEQVGSGAGSRYTDAGPLTVRLSVRNSNPSRFARAGGQGVRAVLADEHGNVYRPHPGRADLPAEGVAEVRPDQPQTEVLVFDRPLPGAKKVFLTIDAGRYGGLGLVRFDIPRAAWDPAAAAAEQAARDREHEVARREQERQRLAALRAREAAAAQQAVADRREAERLAALEAAKPRGVVDAVELWEAFHASPTAAARQYAGKVWQVRGRAVVAREAPRDRLMVGLTTVAADNLTPAQIGRLPLKPQGWARDGFPPNVLCYYSAAHAQEVAAIQPGGVVALIGRVRGTERTDAWDDMAVVVDDARPDPDADPGVLAVRPPVRIPAPPEPPAPKPAPAAVAEKPADPIPAKPKKRGVTLRPVYAEWALAINGETLGLYKTARASGNKAAMDAMVANKQVMIVTGPTEFQKVDQGPTLAYVKPFEGPFAGRTMTASAADFKEE